MSPRFYLLAEVKDQFQEFCYSLQHPPVGAFGYGKELLYNAILKDANYINVLEEVRKAGIYHPSLILSAISQKG
jgi:hypothetical protein